MITGSELVRIVSAIPAVAIACGDVPGGRRGVDEQRLARLERGDHAVADPPLLVDLELEPVAEGVLVGGEVGQHGAAVGAPRVAGAGEDREIAPRGHRGDRELLLEPGDADRALRAQQVEDPRRVATRRAIAAPSSSAHRSREATSLVGRECIGGARRDSGDARCVIVVESREIDNETDIFALD